MKKFLLLLALLVSPICFADTLETSQDVSNINEFNSSNEVQTYYSICGETSYSLGSSSSGVGGVYTLSPDVPVDATIEWEIQGNRGYVYPIGSGSACTVNIYTTGSYRLSCIIRCSDGSVSNPAIYISVRN